MTQRLVLVRHGETEWSRTGRHTGRTDVPLTARGARQAAAIGRALQGWTFALALSSPRRRALDTCRLAGLAPRHDSPAGGRDGCTAAAVETTDDLAEWDYGDYEGRRTEDIRGERPGWLLWADGVPAGESLADVAARADRVVARARSVDGDVVVFGHGHQLRVLTCRWLGLDPGFGRHLALDAGSISVLGWERDVPVIERWNEAAEETAAAVVTVPR